MAKIGGIVLGALAGVLAALDIITLCVLELMLRGASGNALHVPGVAHAEWSRVGGFHASFLPGALAIVVLCVVIGVALALHVVQRPNRPPSPACVHHRARRME